jgi:GNAT superfamily N-acetyltransferase
MPFLTGPDVEDGESVMPAGRQTIRRARADELGQLRDIEAAAGELFADVGMTSISEHGPPPVEVFERYWRDGRAWVSTDSDDRPVAYLIADRVDGNGHIEQVSVHPDFSRRGIGRSLIDHAEAWAASRGLAALTLTTFAEVPWNGPYYSRCGFTPMAEPDMGPELAARWAEERARGLSVHPRVAMIRPVRSDAD